MEVDQAIESYLTLDIISPSSDKVGPADLASTDDRLWDVAPCPLYVRLQLKLEPVCSAS